MSSPDQFTIVEKRRLYVGCGLTLAPQKFKDDVEQLKGELRKEWNVLEFLGLTAGTSGDVYDRDITENVGSCDAFIAVADEASTGLGFELAVATVHLKKPVLATAQLGTKITRLLLGAAERNENMTFLPYEDMAQDVPVLARETFAHVLGGSAISAHTVSLQEPR